MKVSPWVKIERSRNRRLWVKEVIMPVLMWTGLALIIFPSLRNSISDATKQIHKAVKEKLQNEQGSEDEGTNSATESSN